MRIIFTYKKPFKEIYTTFKFKFTGQTLHNHINSFSLKGMKIVYLGIGNTYPFTYNPIPRPTEYHNKLRKNPSIPSRFGEGF